MYTQDPIVLEQVQVIAADGSRVPLSAFTKYEYSMVEDRAGQRTVRRREHRLLAGPGRLARPGAQGDRSRDGRRSCLPTDVQGRLGSSAERVPESALNSQHWLIVGVLGGRVPGAGHSLRRASVHPLTILSTLPSAEPRRAARLRLDAAPSFRWWRSLGLFLLIGIVMKNAILMIDFALARERQDRRRVARSHLRGSQMRLRPILMTNFAALLGALPLLLSSAKASRCAVRSVWRSWAAWL